MMSIAADNTNSSSDSGRDSPTTPSLLSNTWCTSCSNWPEQRELKPLGGADTCTTLGPQSGASLHEPGGLYRCASLVSIDSMASTLLPSISPDSDSPSATRIGTEGSVQSKQYDCMNSTNFMLYDFAFLVYSPVNIDVYWSNRTEVLASNFLSVPLNHLSFDIC